MAPQGQDVKKNIHTSRWCKNHIHEDDEEFNTALMEQNISTKLYMQTPNSPDINLLDLVFLEESRASMTWHQGMKLWPMTTIHNTS